MMWLLACGGLTLSVEEDELPALKVPSKVSSHLDLLADVRPLPIEPFLSHF